MATIGDVAKLAGLSRATVSRVMNNHPYVAEEREKLVNEAMEQLGYTPNSIAQRLRRQTTETIAVLIPRIANPFFSKLVEVMEITAAENGFQLIVCQTRSDKHRELDYLDLLKTKQIGGVILASSENDWKDVKDYTESGPMIFCNEYAPNTNVPIVCLDQFKGGYIGTRHLLEKGHRKIAYCYGSDHVTNISDRQKGCHRALQEFGLSMPDEWWFKDAFEIADGQRIFREIMALSDRPSAVFSGSDEVAAGMIKEAKKHHVKVPDELAVVGHDDQPIAELTDPAMTTIYQPVGEIEKKTMELMIDFLKEGKKPEQQMLELPLHLVVRDST